MEHKSPWKCTDATDTFVEKGANIWGQGDEQDSVSRSLQDINLDPDHRTKLETYEQLQVVWDAIGTSEEERQAHLNELSQLVQAIYINRLQEQRDARDTCEEKIRGLQAAMGNLCEQLQVPHPEPVSTSITLLQQIECLTGQLDLLKQERERQHARNGKALAELAHLYTHMGEPLPADTQRLQLGAHRLTEIQSLIGQAHQKIAEKKLLLETARAKIHAELQELCFEEEEYSQLDRLVLLNASEIPLSALGELARRGTELEEIKNDRKNQLKALAKKIGDNWKILGIPAEHRKEFMDGEAGLGRSTFEKCERELAELEAEKRVRLPQFLEKLEEQLRLLWSETSVLQSDQDLFMETYSGFSNEEKFDRITEQINEMDKRCKEMQPLLDLVMKREKIKSEEESYSALQHDPNRFKIPGRPLQLERMRKDFNSFPKLAAKMKQEIEAWEAVNGPFIRNGERLLTTMENLGEFEEGYIPGGVEPRRSATLKPEPTCTPRRPPVRSTTIPRSVARTTPSKREEMKGTPLVGLTPIKREAVSVVASARKKPFVASVRKADRENHYLENSHHVKVATAAEPGKGETPKRAYVPLSESNH